MAANDMKTPRDRIDPAPTRVTAGSKSEDEVRTPREAGDDAAPHLTPTTPSEDARTVLLNQVTWGAVLAGIVAILVLQLILNMIGVGVGASTLNPAAGSDNPSVTTFSAAAAIWWVISGIIASFVGGYAAGRLAGVPKESTAGWHGLTAWAAATLIVFYLVTSAVGGLLGGAYQTVSGALTTATQATAQTQGNQSLLNILGGGSEAAQAALASAIRASLTGDQGQVQQARDQAAQAIAQSQNIPVEEARTRVQNFENQYRQTLQQARATANQAADTVSSAALVGAVALILGALAAWFGGRSGAVHPTLTDFVLRGRTLRTPFERRRM